MEEKPWHRHYDYNVPTSIRYPRITALEILQIPANSFPDKAALNFYGTEMSFLELRRTAMRMANALGALGVQKGDRVGIHLPNCPQYLIAHYAILYLGAIVVNINPMYTPDELKNIVENTGITTLFTFDIFLSNIRTLCKNVEIKKVIVTKITDYIDGMGISTPKDLDLEPGWHHFSQLLDSSPSTKVPRIEVFPEDPAIIIFTGGTTGIPKGAVLTHANVVAATLQCTLWGNATMHLNPPERCSVLAMSPYFHVYGTIVVNNWAMFNCATQIQVPRFEIDELMGILANFDEITFFPTFPTLISAMVNHPKAAEIDIGRRLRLLNSGGQPCPVELIEQVKDMGVFISEGFGMTETTSLGISNPVLGLKKVGSVGIPFPDTDVKIVDPENGVEEVPNGKPGELILKSPLIMQGYWNNPEETAGQIRDGWLYTGDIVEKDEDDYFYIVDRKKDMIIASGYNIYPREIDEVLYQHPKIQDAVAVGIPDEYRGETVKAFIVLKKGKVAKEEEIIAFARERLAAYKAPKIIEFRDELPKSAVGKVLRKVLRAEEEAKKGESSKQS